MKTKRKVEKTCPISIIRQVQNAFSERSITAQDPLALLRIEKRLDYPKIFAQPDFGACSSFSASSASALFLWTVPSGWLGGE
jgi:hypothetical protein